MSIFGKPGRGATWPLTAVCAALAVGFVEGPAILLRNSYPQFAGEESLREGLSYSLVEFWQGDGDVLPPTLAELVHYWGQWHAIKIGVAVLLVAVSGLLAAALWRRTLVAGPANRRVMLRQTTVAGCATLLALTAVVLTAANIQATAVPMVALLPLLPAGHANGALAGTLVEIAGAVRDSSDAHRDSPALAVLVDQVVHYHAVMIAVASALAVTFGAGSVAVVRRRSSVDPADHPRRVMLATLGAAGMVMTLFLSTVAGFSAVALADPSGALLDILGL